MKRKRLLTIAGLALALWQFATPDMAYGQGNTWAGTSLAQTVESAKWRFGALRVNAALVLDNAGYDSDVYYGYVLVPVPDYTFSAGTTIQALLSVNKKIVFEIFDNPQYVFYLDTKRERAWNNTFRGNVHFALDRIYIQAGGGIANVRQRFSPELNVNIRQKENSLNGLVLWQLSRETSLALLYGGADYEYGDAEFGGMRLAEILNRKENSFDFITYLQPNSRVRFYLDGQYGTYAFTEGASDLRDTRSYGVYGGLEFIPRTGEARQTEGMQGSISLGYKRFDIINPLLDDGSDLVGAINLSAGLLKKTTARAFFSRDFQFSAYSIATYYLSTAFGGGITRYLSRRVSILYDLSFGRASYPEGEGGGIPQGDYNRYTTHMFSLNIGLSRNLEITLLGILGRRTMGEIGLAGNRNFFGFNLIYGVPAGQISTPSRGLAR